MTPTVAFGALAVALGLVVAVLLAWPLRRSSPRQFAGVVVVIPLLAVGLYALVGSPASLVPSPRSAPQTLDEALADLEAGLQRDPRQVEGWRLLGRAYAQRQQPAKSRDAFARAAALAPDDDDIQVEFAEASALADPARRFDAESIALLREVLARTPSHQRARWFLGIAQRQAGDGAGAADTWTPLLAQVDEKTAASLRTQIDAARKDAGLPPMPSQEPTAPETSKGTVRVRVSLEPGLASRIRPDGNASVFVIARIPGGPPMPVAVERHAVRDLPLDITLDDGDSPMPTRKLSDLDAVELVARLSLSGDAARGEGDLESSPIRITLPVAEPVSIVLGE
ncbi:tetratricopeptide repeat protein [Luteimonas vadosa]|uniref:Tetratricopeptide repeat protein n=1 Tax=Luteimonas vadosa TaxID=1165507 RepID=A0ABP9E1H5_9GAMM